MTSQLGVIIKLPSSRTEIQIELHWRGRVAFILYLPDDSAHCVLNYLPTYLPTYLLR